MTAPRRRPLTTVLAVVAALVLVAAAVLAYRATTADGPSAADTPRDTSTPTSTTTSTSTRATPEADPSVAVTPRRDPTQPADARSAALADVDGGAQTATLQLPAIGLSTPLVPQGLRGGKVNPLPQQVIWFTGNERVVPGAVGTSVVAGHVSSSGGADQFAALDRLKKGDGVVLTYPSGTELRLEVTRTHVVDKEELRRDQDVWGANDDTRRVVLVTCDDVLGFREDGHRKANLVVVAELPE